MGRCVRRRRGVSRRGFLAAAAAGGVVCAGCRKETPEQSETHLRVMAEPWMFLKYPLRRAKEQFGGEHPGVTVELLKAPDGYQTRLLVAMMSRRSEADLVFGPVQTTVMLAPGAAGAVPAGTRSVVIPRNSRAVRLARRFVEEEMFGLIRNSRTRRPTARTWDHPETPRATQRRAAVAAVFAANRASSWTWPQTSRPRHLADGSISAGETRGRPGSAFG